MVITDKRALRSRMIKKRSEISSEDYARKNECISNVLMNFEAETVFGYSSVNGEVDISEYMASLFKKGIKTAFPICLDRYGNMEFKLVSGFEDLKKGAFNVLEPLSSLASVEKGDIILVPGVAFDKKGYRLGYGKGYYDRYLSVHEGFIKIGIAFEEQIADTVFPLAHDCRMDMIITDKNVYDFRE